MFEQRRQNGGRTILSLLTCATLVTFLNAAPEIAAKQQTPAARTAPLFDFHSNFWVNLHQLLFHEALLRAGKPDRRLQSNTPLGDPDMTEQEKADWSDAVAFYSTNFGSRSELFDEEMVKVNDELAKQPDDGAHLNAPALPSGLAAVLQSAAPIYRKYWWPAHSKSNQDWISSQSARVETLGPQIASAMEKDLREQWPVAPLRVDVSYYVPQIGHAYTTDGPPPHTTFSGSAPSLQDLSGFETLFHEASHSFAGTMGNALSAECATAKRNCGDLWHAVLFYTAGVETRRALPPAERANFTPYAYKYGLYNRGDYPKYRRVLETDWQAYLDGKTSFQAAIRSMVADLP
ncbi:MAG TPA: hypothetical protein VGS59_08535 [Candidatus Acidoferrales bacterium]|nr:hypothetical protein [Candidatus Acidoferrales bacterium]